MKLLKVLKWLYHLGSFLYQQLDEGSPVADEAEFLMGLAQYLMKQVDAKYPNNA